MKQLEIPTLKSELKQLILDGLRRRYVSVSGDDGIETGNHYQSVTLGDERTSGFRSDRAAFLDRIDFQGKRVLDLGSNLGEISRAARTRGAAMVDGYEYDPFFVEMAQLVNAYNGTTRVSFHQRDITKPETYVEHYDVVLAFSVYEYLRLILNSIADKTDGVLVLETHRLERNLETLYLNPIGRIFPHHMIIGSSDWGSGRSGDGERAVVIFAKAAGAIHKHVKGLNMPGRQFNAGRRSGSELDIRSVDVLRTPWYDKFFTKFHAGSAKELLTAVQGMDLEVEAIATDDDLASNAMAGWIYWLLYVKGALQSADGGAVGPGNAYYDLLAGHWKNNDPGRAADLSDEDRLAELVSRRFADFELFRSRPDAAHVMQPIRLVVPAGPPTPSRARGVKRIYEFDREVPVETTTIDGYHRLFLARLFGHTHAPCDFVAEEDAVPDSNA